VLLAALSPRLGRIDRVVYDENGWAPTSPHLEFRGNRVILEASSSNSINTLSLIGERFGTFVILVVPPYTKPAHAYSAVITAAHSDDVSTADELLGIGVQNAQDRRVASMARQRWESDGGAVCGAVGRGSGPTSASRDRDGHHAQ
jgi:hypothetical protein